MHCDAVTLMLDRAHSSVYATTHLNDKKARLAVIGICFENFTVINDTFGHSVEDKMISALDKRLCRWPQASQIAVRSITNKFWVALLLMGENEIENCCRYMLELLTALIVHEGGKLLMSASIGIAMAPTHGISLDELLRTAGKAFYRLKNNGRRTDCFFSTRMNDRLQANWRQTDDMRLSIPAGQFLTEFQPRFDDHSKTSRSAEALVRWHYPEHGKMAPDLFMPLAKRSNFTLPLGDWVLLDAKLIERDWSETGAFGKRIAGAVPQRPAGQTGVPSAR